MSLPISESSPFRFSFILAQRFFLLTALVHIIVWMVTFAAQCWAEARHRATNPGPGTPVGIGWFAIFYQLVPFACIINCVGRDAEHEARTQLAILVAVNVVCGILACNSGIYARHEIGLTIFGFGWMILSVINLSWLFYFTCPEDSRLLSYLSPGFQRKQRIRSSISIRRSHPYGNPGIPNIASASRIDLYAGTQEVSLGGLHAGTQNHMLVADKGLENLVGYHDQHEMASFVSLHFRHPQPSEPLLPQQDLSAHAQHHAPPQQYNYYQDPGRRQHQLSRPTPPEIDLNYRSQSPPASSLPTSTYPTLLLSTIVSSESPVTPLTHHTPQPSVNPICDESGTAASTTDQQTQYPSSRPTTSRISHLTETTGLYSKRAKALYTYKTSSVDPREIDFDKGEVLEIRSHSGKWWKARRENGDEGIVPSNYVQMIED